MILTIIVYHVQLCLVCFSFDFSGVTSLQAKRQNEVKVTAEHGGKTQAVFMWWELEMDTEKQIILSCAPHWAHPHPHDMPVSPHPPPLMNHPSSSLIQSCHSKWPLSVAWPLDAGDLLPAKSSVSWEGRIVCVTMFSRRIFAVVRRCKNVWQVRISFNASSLMSVGRGKWYTCTALQLDKASIYMGRLLQFVDTSIKRRW